MAARLALTLGLWRAVFSVQVLEKSFLAQKHLSAIAEQAADDHIDAIIVLGGGLTENGHPKEWVVARLTKALYLYRRSKGPAPSGNPYVICSGASSANLETSVVTEAEACARFLIEHQVGTADILEEPLARDTDGNAYFSRLLHTETLGLHTLTIVTSQFQMERTKVIFNHVFSLQPVFGQKYNLSFATTANLGVQQEALKARAAKEKNSTAYYNKNVVNITKLTDYHRFMFGDHMAYASERLFSDVSRPLSIDLKGTYVENEKDAEALPTKSEPKEDAELPPLYGYTAKF